MRTFKEAFGRMEAGREEREEVKVEEGVKEERVGVGEGRRGEG